MSNEQAFMMLAAGAINGRIGVGFGCCIGGGVWVAGIEDNLKIQD